MNVIKICERCKNVPAKTQRSMYCSPCFLDRKRERDLKYYYANKRKRNKARVDQDRKRRRIDPEYRMMQNTKKRIKKAIKKYNSPKDQSSIKYLDCSQTFFIQWIEFQFVPGMTLDNHGSIWHLDHVNPIANHYDGNEFDYKCFHWTNYQPLFSLENIKKSDTVDEELIQKHKLKVKDFLKTVQ